MPDLYGATALTPLRVARASGYIDWASQPSLFKHYPEFLYRCGFDAHPELAAIALARCITSESVVGGKPYYRLVTPSAGNLHPVELYVQIRGLKGVLSGLYHVDALRNELVLIRECGAEGLEPVLGMANRFEGMLFVVSVVPFRSEWKYGHRAYRYCYMDAGHQVGALYAAMQARGPDAVTGWEVDALNRAMGFGDEEFAAAVVAVGSEGSKPAQVLKSPSIRVSPTDYRDSDGTVPGWIGTAEAGEAFRPAARTISDESVWLKRRSARKFAPKPLETAAFEHIMHTLSQTPAGITAYAAVQRPDHVAPGLYRGGQCLKEGDFSQTMVSLLVDQRFTANAEIVMILCAQTYDARRQMEAAAFAHALSLDAAVYGAGYTAIGAFYDTKMQTFLETSAPILYVGVFGTEE